jgi:hypothetical protein
LIKKTEEKEEAVEKARADLEVKERKLEEDKALLEEGRSENESVTSSLTASSSVSAQHRGAQGSATKRMAAPADSCNDAAKSTKKQKIEESTTKEPGDERRGGPQCHSISLGKMSSSISDVTDSNRGSSDSGGEKADGAANKKRRHCDEISETPSTSTVSSTAAVIREAGSEHREHGHADVVVKTSRDRKRSRQQRCRERSSLNRKFDLDYEEVFLTSNLPQIIATPAGHVVACKFAKCCCFDCTVMLRVLTNVLLVYQ